MDEIYAFFDQHREEIKKDFIDSALEYALWTGGRSDWGNNPSSSDLEKNRNMLPGQTNLVRIDYKSFVKEIMNRYTTLLYGKSSSSLVDNLFNAIEEELPGNSYSKPAIFQDALHEWLEKNIDMSNIGSIMEGAYNYATQKTHEIESPSDPKILLEQYKKEFKVSKWKKVSASPELIQKMQNQFYDPEQIIVANYVQQSGKSITVNPRNLEYWEKAEIVSDLMQDRKLVSNLFDEAETFAHSFIKKYNLNDAEIIKEKFIELIEEEINDVRDMYLDDIYNQIYFNAEKVGKGIAQNFMEIESNPNWSIAERLDEIQNLENEHSSLYEYATLWESEAEYEYKHAARFLEQSSLDEGWGLWYDGLQEGFWSTINVEKLKDSMGADTSYLYKPVSPSQEAFLDPEQTDENEAKKHRRNIADKWKIQYDPSPGKKLNWATEEDFPKKPWDFQSKVAAPNQFLPRLYHTMIENLKRTATFDWESESNAWQKIQVAYEILNDWDNYVEEIKEESGYQGQSFSLSALMRDVFIDIFTPVWETISYLSPEEQSAWINLHSNIAGTYPSTPYQIDAQLFNIFQPPDRKKDFSDISKELREERTDEIKDKWKPQDWWKGSKWKKISVDESNEQEQERLILDALSWFEDQIQKMVFYNDFNSFKNLVEFLVNDLNRRRFLEEDNEETILESLYPPEGDFLPSYFNNLDIHFIYDSIDLQKLWEIYIEEFEHDPYDPYYDDDLNPFNEELERIKRTNEIQDKWKPEDWWRGSKWKKVSADEHDEEEEEVEPEIRTWWEVDGDVDEGFRRIDLYYLARSYVEQYSWPDEIWSHVLPRNVFDDEEKFVEFVDGLKYTDASRLASDWIEQHHDEIIDYLVDSIYQEYDYSVFTDEEFNQYQSEIDERVSEMVYDYAYETQSNVVNIVEREFEDELYDIQESVFEKYREYLEEKDRRIHPDQEMMDVFDVKGELPPPPQEEPPHWLKDWMRQQSKVSNNEDWSQETEILIDYILKDNRIINPTIDVMEKIVQQGGSPEELANWTIENVLNEYNDQIAQQWEQVSDEEDIEDQKQQLRRTWKQQARKQFPFSLKKQKQYVQEMEQMQFGLFGEPEPEKIEKYLLKVENIDWQGIYDWIKEDLQYRRKMASSSEEEQYQKIKESEIIQDVFDKLYTAGVGQANREIPQLIKTQTGREPYEYIYYSPSELDNLPRPDRFYDEDQLSIFREQFSSDKETLEKKAFYSAKKEFEPIVASISALLTAKIDWERVYQDGAEYWIQGYWDGIRGLYKNNLEIARAKRKDPEGWRQSKWKVISNQRQYEIDWTDSTKQIFEQIINELPQEIMNLAKERVSKKFERDMENVLTPGGDIDYILDNVEDNLSIGHGDFLNRKMIRNQLPLSFENLKNMGELSLGNPENPNQLSTFRNFLIQDAIETLLEKYLGERPTDVLAAMEDIANSLSIDELKNLFNIFIKTWEEEWDRLFKEKTSSHGQRQMAIGDEVAETTFEGVEVDPDPEPEEKIINGKKWKMVRPKPNKQPADYAKPKGGWGFYSRHKKSDLNDWTDSTKLAIEQIIEDLPNRLRVRAAINADGTVKDWIQRSLKEKLESTKWYNPYYNFDQKRWEDGEGQEILLNPYEERMTPFHNLEENRFIHKNQIRLGLEQVRNMADIALWRYDRFDQNLYWELGQLILDAFSGINEAERKNIEKDIYNIINERELESIYNDAYYKAWEKAFNEEVFEEEKSLTNKSSKKDAWEAVLDGELGHDILTTGTWEEVKKQTIKWLKQFKDGFLNKKNPHDNKKIDADAKEQDAHAIEDLKLYDEEKRWSFHFDHGKHPYDLIIQPVGYKESKWIKSKLSEDLIIEEKIGQVI